MEADPRRFFVPPYLGPKGWVGVRLDLPRMAWGEIAYLVGTAYRMSAPRALVARLESPPIQERAKGRRGTSR